MKFIFPLLVIFCLSCQSQTTYKSLASEYFYPSLESNFEWMERDIIIGSETITIKSYGSEAIVIQTWRIQNKTYADSKTKAFTIYNVELASGEEMEYPASFDLQFNSKGKVETITCEIPQQSQNRLPDNSPIKTRFLID